MNKLSELKRHFKKRKSYGVWLLGYSKPYIPKLMLLMAIGFVTTLVSTGMAVLSKRIIDNAGANLPIKGALLAYFALTLFMLATGAFCSLWNITMNERFSFGIRKQLYDKIVHSYWMDVKKYHTGDLMTRLTTDAGNVADGIIGTIPTIVQLALELVVAFFTLLYFQPILAVFALMLGPVAALSSLILGRKLKQIQKKVLESESAYRSFLQESLANILIVKSFHNEEYAVDKLTELREQRFKWVYKKGIMGIASQSSMSFFFSFAYIIAFSIGALMISDGTISYGTMSLFLVLINRIQSPIIGLAQMIPQVVSIFTSAERVMELENLTAEAPQEISMDTEALGVKVDHLNFQYVEGETVLEDVSLDIAPGEFVAIVGESGIGKTTLVRLMMSFMSNYQGSIEYYNPQKETMQTGMQMRSRIAYVPQGNTLFSGTIRENIRMGKLDATEEEMLESLKMAAAYDFVMELPNGIDTVIGERGHGLSEGQAQRIAIARCLIRKAPFVILDEATSSLDTETEIRVLQGLQQLSPRPTCVIITHRISILPYCDRQIKIANACATELF